jgi:hypothetical protein
VEGHKRLENSDRLDPPHKKEKNFPWYPI